METHSITVKSPLGPLIVSEGDGSIVALDWGSAVTESPTPLLALAAQQLDAYFYCDLRKFDLPLAPAGTAFQQLVWREMLRIPYGRTRSYADVARDLDSAPRAIGGACGKNPIPIIIPCHRVLASGDRLGGYSSPGGADTKQFLLQLEGARRTA
ncbi:MAG: methylated-DNA--[protein]-cysteine S-methyltransferase [Dongiaceae bacterium]